MLNIKFNVREITHTIIDKKIYPCEFDNFAHRKDDRLHEGPIVLTVKVGTKIMEVERKNCFSFVGEIPPRAFVYRHGNQLYFGERSGVRRTPYGIFEEFVSTCGKIFHDYNNEILQSI